MQTACELKREPTAEEQAEMMMDWEAIMAEVEAKWPGANPATVYMITSDIISKTLER